ncbi:hypothetical protein SMICM304S_01314 [Streptomyces microflavus]
MRAALSPPPGHSCCGGGRPNWPWPAGIPGLYLGHLAFAPLIALYFLAVHRRSAAPGAVGAVLVALAQFLPLPLGDVTLLRLDHDTVLDALDSCALGVGAFVLGRSARCRRERLREITESRERENRLLAQHTLATERARRARRRCTTSSPTSVSDSGSASRRGVLTMVAYGAPANSGCAGEPFGCDPGWSLR